MYEECFLSNEHEIFMETPGGFEEEIFAEYLCSNTENNLNI